VLRNGEPIIRGVASVALASREPLRGAAAGLRRSRSPGVLSFRAYDGITTKVCSSR
jgi:hypothetical protein